MKISLALPFHNEKENLKILLPLIEKNLLKIDKYSYEVNLVDDLSNDESFEECEKFINSTKSKVIFNLFRLEKKGFQSGALKKGFYESTGDYIICMDTDLQDDPEYLPNFIEKISNNFEIVIGLRKNRKAPSILRSGLKVYDYIFEKIFKDKEQLICTILFANNLVNVLASALATKILIEQHFCESIDHFLIVLYFRGRTAGKEFAVGKAKYMTCQIHHDSHVVFDHK